MDHRKVKSIKVETARWSKAGQLDLSVKKNGRNGGVAYAVLTAVKVAQSC